MLRYTIRISPRQLARVEELASLENRKAADIIRMALDAYLGGNTQVTASKMRHLRISEYTQIALDHIIRQDYPEDRDRLIAQTDLRMEQHHGA
jgi:hypothetical protein